MTTNSPASALTIMKPNTNSVMRRNMLVRPQIDLQVGQHALALLRQCSSPDLVQSSTSRCTPDRPLVVARIRSSFVTPESSRQHHERDDDDGAGDDEVDQRER